MSKKLPNCKIIISKLEIGDRVALVDMFGFVMKYGIITGYTDATHYDVQWDGSDYSDQWISGKSLFYQKPEPKFRVGDRIMVISDSHPKWWKRGTIRSRHADSIYDENHYAINCDDGLCHLWMNEKEICHEKRYYD